MSSTRCSAGLMMKDLRQVFPSFAASTLRCTCIRWRSGRAKTGGTSVGYASKFPRTEPKKNGTETMGPCNLQFDGSSDARTAVDDGRGEVKQSVVAEINP